MQCYGIAQPFGGWMKSPAVFSKDILLPKERRKMGPKLVFEVLFDVVVGMAVYSFILPLLAKLPAVGSFVSDHQLVISLVAMAVFAEMFQISAKK